MSVPAKDLASDPAWLPHRLVDGGRAIRFVRADRAAQRAATFLDDASLGEGAARADAAAAEVAAALPATRAPMHFIFHSAFARSTLLARAMDLPGVAMGLKEPIILNDAAQLHRQRQLGRETLALALGLLGRPLAAGEAVVVKPSNVVNLLMPSLMALRPDARALLLFRDLPGFLRSIARKGMFGRIWARRLLWQVRAEAPFDAGFSEGDRFAHTDLQAAALGWLIQHAQFAALARAMPERVRVLDAAALANNARATFAASLDWFGLTLDDAAIDAVVRGPAFAEDSKRIGERFGGEGAGQDAPVDPNEIAMVTRWAEAVAGHVGLSLDFGPALLPAR
jgi:hypothetical protein